MTENEKRYQYIKELIDSNSKAHIVANIKNFGVDIDKLKQEPYLFKMMTRIFSGEGNSEIQKLWNNYEKAYYELKSKNMLSISFNEQYQEQLKQLKEKVVGSCLIPVSEIEECVIEKKRNKEVSFEIAYYEFTKLIEQYYGIKTRDFFIKNKSKNSSENIIFSKEEEEIIRNLKPSDDYRAAMLAIVYDVQNEEKIYADFWHYMIEHDFSQVRNGCVQTMWIDYEDWDADEDREERLNTLTAKLYDLIRQVYFKEIAQLPYYQGQKVKSIQFWVEW